MLVPGESTSRAFVGGLFCYVPALEWIRVAHPAMYGAWIFLAFCCSIFLVMTLAIIRKLDRAGLPLWLSAPIGFIAMEYFRSHFPTGYTWLEYFTLDTLSASAGTWLATRSTITTR